MDYKILISKIAVDKENEKLGKIIRIDELIGKTIKKYIPYAMIQIKIGFRKKLVVPIEAKKAVKVEGAIVQFDLLKKDFDEIAERIRLSKEEREKYHGDLAVRLSRGKFPDQTGLGSRARERKR
ncbi:MAG: hypothetical protein FK732_05750 [Asgard group archaeon]|nr:hypothetical protein [Asgard group archaeon]